MKEKMKENEKLARKIKQKTKHILTLFQARHRSTSSVSTSDWAEQVEAAEQAELNMARKAAIARMGKIPADPKAKVAGFLPSSSRKNNGRGAKNPRGTTRGRGATRGTRGATGGARGVKTTPRATKASKAKASEAFDPETAGNETDESEIDETLPIMSQIRHALAKTSKNSSMAPTGNITVLNQTIKDAMQGPLTLSQHPTTQSGTSCLKV